MSNNRKKLIELAKLAEQAERYIVIVHRIRLHRYLFRYPDMMNAMKKAVEMNSELTDEERELLSTAYKQVACALRSAWHTLFDAAQDAQSDNQQQETAKEYSEQIGNELKDVCHEILVRFT